MRMRMEVKKKMSKMNTMMQYEFEDCHDFSIVHRFPFFISIGVAGLSHDLRHEERFYVEATFTLTPEDGPIGTWTFQ